LTSNFIPAKFFHISLAKYFLTLTTRRDLSPQVNINNIPIPIKTEVKYLGLHLDQKLTWIDHLKAKRRQFELKPKVMYWLMNKKSEICAKNKLTIYKAILEPVWTYGVELWGYSKPSNTKTLQSYESETLRMINGAPWFVSNLTLHNASKIPFVHQEITLHANNYKLRTTGHSNRPISELFHQSNDVRRLQRIWPQDVAR
jgi:hypothetical protein